MVRKTFALRSADVVDIWVGRPPAVAELWRGRHPVAGFGLKFDWADLFDHVVILRARRLGFPRALHFTPEDPHSFVAKAKVALKL